MDRSRTCSPSLYYYFSYFIVRLIRFAGHSLGKKACAFHSCPIAQVSGFVGGFWIIKNLKGAQTSPQVWILLIFGPKGTWLSRPNSFGCFSIIALTCASFCQAEWGVRWREPVALYLCSSEDRRPYGPFWRVILFLWVITTLPLSETYTWQYKIWECVFAGS